MLGPLIADVDGFLAALRRGRAVNVNDQSSKDRVIALAAEYFNGARPELMQVLGESDELLQLDDHWQQLVRLAQGNNARRTYSRLAANIRRGLAELNVAALIAGPADRP